MMAKATSWSGMKLPAAFQQPRYKDQHGGPLVAPVTFVDLAVTLLCIAAVVGIDDCTDIKLVLEDNFENKGDFMARIGVMRSKTIPFRSHDLFAHISRLLLGRDLALAVSAEDSGGDGDCFMVSDFGWTISLPTYGDSDPFTIVRDSLFIRKGVVTNARAMERKNRVRDALPPSIEVTGNTDRDVKWIRDRGEETFEENTSSI
ncbi:uncharacterized protein BDR25DRAFT_362916 [Neofusicoccum parvum]|nr:uncharacterized protein BDR25DRAFT_362916 [Neofusicoccum parvum]